jgi:hypothetical protein
MSKYTKGPWRVGELSNCMIDVLHDNKEKGAITMALCRVQARASWLSESEANAKLIASAPDLLETLDLIVRRLNADIEDGTRPDQWSMQALVDKANDAIKKAIGE